MLQQTPTGRPRPFVTPQSRTETVPSPPWWMNYYRFLEIFETFDLPTRNGILETEEAQAQAVHSGCQYLLQRLRISEALFRQFLLPRSPALQRILAIGASRTDGDHAEVSTRTSQPREQLPLATFLELMQVTGTHLEHELAEYNRGMQQQYNGIPGSTSNHGGQVVDVLGGVGVSSTALFPGPPPQAPVLSMSSSSTSASGVPLPGSGKAYGYPYDHLFQLRQQASLEATGASATSGGGGALAGSFQPDSRQGTKSGDVLNASGFAEDPTNSGSISRMRMSRTACGVVLQQARRMKPEVSASGERFYYAAEYLAGRSREQSNSQLTPANLSRVDIEQMLPPSTTKTSLQLASLEQVQACKFGYRPPARSGTASANRSKAGSPATGNNSISPTAGGFQQQFPGGNIASKQSAMSFPSGREQSTSKEQLQGEQSCFSSRPPGKKTSKHFAFSPTDHSAKNTDKLTHLGPRGWRYAQPVRYRNIESKVKAAWRGPPLMDDNRRLSGNLFLEGVHYPAGADIEALLTPTAQGGSLRNVGGAGSFYNVNNLNNFNNCAMPSTATMFQTGAQQQPQQFNAGASYGGASSSSTGNNNMSRMMSAPVPVVAARPILKRPQAETTTTQNTTDAAAGGSLAGTSTIAVQQPLLEGDASVGAEGPQAGDSSPPMGQPANGNAELFSQHPSSTSNINQNAATTINHAPPLTTTALRTTSNNIVVPLASSGSLTGSLRQHLMVRHSPKSRSSAGPRISVGSHMSSAFMPVQNRPSFSTGGQQIVHVGTGAATSSTSSGALSAGGMKVPPPTGAAGGMNVPPTGVAPPGSFQPHGVAMQSFTGQHPPVVQIGIIPPQEVAQQTLPQEPDSPLNVTNPQYIREQMLLMQQAGAINGSQAGAPTSSDADKNIGPPASAIEDILNAATKATSSSNKSVADQQNSVKQASSSSGGEESAVATTTAKNLQGGPGQQQESEPPPGTASGLSSINPKPQSQTNKASSVEPVKLFYPTPVEITHGIWTKPPLEDQIQNMLLLDGRRRATTFTKIQQNLNEPAPARPPETTSVGLNPGAALYHNVMSYANAHTTRGEVAPRPEKQNQTTANAEMPQLQGVKPQLQSGQHGHMRHNPNVVGATSSQLRDLQLPSRPGGTTTTVQLQQPQLQAHLQAPIDMASATGSEKTILGSPRSSASSGKTPAFLGSTLTTGGRMEEMLPQEQQQLAVGKTPTILPQELFLPASTNTTAHPPQRPPGQQQHDKRQQIQAAPFAFYGGGGASGAKVNFNSNLLVSHQGLLAGGPHRLHHRSSHSHQQHHTLKEPTPNAKGTPPEQDAPDGQGVNAQNKLENRFSSGSSSSSASTSQLLVQQNPLFNIAGGGTSVYPPVIALPPAPESCRMRNLNTASLLNSVCEKLETIGTVDPLQTTTDIKGIAQLVGGGSHSSSASSQYSHLDQRNTLDPETRQLEARLQELRQESDRRRA
ncbi:unnamed protein product [Amoebophrya sp. A25]|nr:unnamed protein product [Amoebophrya sp. A25]|eukprot:GSA25T00026398001.1